MSFPKINPKQSFPKLEEEILAFWEKEKVFEASLKKKSPKGEFKFFDGPPFATGLPHYGHILQGVIKDLIPRYKTMQGYKVPRVWGWDCHGLPVENLIEKELGLKNKQEIEEFGIAKFNEKCRESVLKFADEWEKTVKRMGRWIDMENSYKTMDLEYMDSVWWVFGELWKKGLIYEGLKPMHVCPRCATPLSNFEVGLNYKDVTDLSAIAKFELVDSVNSRVSSGVNEKTYLLAWTTTPWTLPGNVALAVNPKVEYARISVKSSLTQKNEIYILANAIWQKKKSYEKFPINQFIVGIKGNQGKYEILSEKTFKGSELVGKTYKPLFPYSVNNPVNPRDISGVNGNNISEVNNNDISGVNGNNISEVNDDDISGVNDGDKDLHEVIPGLYFITFNTENSTPVFKDEKLRDSCAEAFREVAEKHNYEIYELAVMPDHIHLVINIEESGDSLPRALQQLKGSSSHSLKSLLTPELTRGLTARQDSQGREYNPVWRKGYDKKFIHSDEEYFNVSDYIRQNPEKKNLPEQKYNWLKTYDDVNQPVKFTKQKINSEKPENTFRIVAADFVTTNEGTGIVHIAPAFGEDDYNLAKKENLPVVKNVSLDGKYLPEVTDFAGIEVKPKDDPTKTDRKIVEFLGDKIFATQNYKHSYPFCWRCESPLLNYTTSSWFVAVEKLKSPELTPGITTGLLENNEEINWSPEHIKNGRFGKWLEGARDWAISRNRFWGAPLPIWKCEKCEETKCISSRAELEKLANENRTKDQEPKTIEDLHKHFVDEIEIACDCGAKMQRIPEVLDCWFESGSMPFASQHSALGNQESEKSPDPKTEICEADFIAEAQDQTRGWFYTLHVLSTAIQNKPAFKNCVCSGLILAEDGAKMSKSKQNFPPPAKIFDEFGADAMRLYLMNSPVTHAADLRFSEKGVEEILRGILLPLWNTFYFFTTYANADDWKQSDLPKKIENPLDRWILSELNILIRDMTASLEKFEIQKAVAPLADFLDGLTNWYVRRSRRRFWKSESDDDKNAAYATLFEVLKTVAKLLAPITPFLAEKIWQNLTGDKSVHLENWSETDESRIDENLSAEVKTTRKIISLGLKIRANEKIKVRQPLQSAKVNLGKSLKISDEQKNVISEELNIKSFEVIDDPTNLAKPLFILNPKILGSKFKDRMQKAIAIAKEGKVEETKKGWIVEGMDDIIIQNNEINIRWEPTPEHKNLAIEANDDIIVALDTKLTPELELEGKARDLVRIIQDLRKKADFDVSDRIELQLENAEAILKVHQKYIATETLAEKISSQIDSPDAKESLENIKIGVKKISQ